MNNVTVRKGYVSSDHFPVVASMSFRFFEHDSTEPYRDRIVNWKRASVKMLEAYSQLNEKVCCLSLANYQRGTIDGPTLYNELVSNLQNAATTCLPKYKSGENRQSDDIPMWKEKMQTVQHNVNYWLST